MPLSSLRTTPTPLLATWGFHCTSSALRTCHACCAVDEHMSLQHMFLFRMFCRLFDDDLHDVHVPYEVDTAQLSDLATCMSNPVAFDRALVQW